jgi:UMF1 family MFS transporter
VSTAAGSRRTRWAPLLRRPVIGWALCDWANSAFATTVMAGFFPVFFKQYWSAGAEATLSTFRLGLANGVASFVVAIAAPLIGAIADKSGARVRLLALFTLLGAAMTAGLSLIARGQWVLAAAGYVVASVGFWGGNQFYDSLIMDVAEEREFDLVSGYGYGLGYLGGGLLFAVNTFMVYSPATFGLADAGAAVRVSFMSVGVWWLVFTVPAMFLIREHKPDHPVHGLTAALAGWRELTATLRSVRRFRQLTYFLLAYWFYIDGVNTVIKMAIDYGMSLGLKPASLLMALLVTQFVAFPAALAFGWFGARFGPRSGILVAIGVYTAITLGAYYVDTEREFLVLAIVVGLVQGGIQSLSRSLFGRLVPAGKSGEFFGFYNMMGKFAAVLGPTLTGIVALVTHDSRLGIMSIALLFVLGGALLLRVREDGDRPEF